MYHRRRIRNYSLGKNIFLSALCGRGGVHGSAQNSVLNVFSPPSARLLAAVFFVFGARCSSRRGFSSPPVADRLCSLPKDASPSRENVVVVVSPRVFCAEAPAPEGSRRTHAPFA
ncbi:hypothetical protein MTO96_001077 [Rhipicephalus appendiculatus]